MGAQCCSSCSAPIMNLLARHRSNGAQGLIETEALLTTNFSDAFDDDEHALMTEDQIKELVEHQMALSAELNQQLEEEERALKEEEEAYFRASRLASAQRKSQALAALPADKTSTTQQAATTPQPDAPEGKRSSLDEVAFSFGSFDMQAQQQPAADLSLPNEPADNNNVQESTTAPLDPLDMQIEHSYRAAELSKLYNTICPTGISEGSNSRISKFIAASELAANTLDLQAADDTDSHRARFVECLMGPCGLERMDGTQFEKTFEQFMTQAQHAEPNEELTSVAEAMPDSGVSRSELSIL